MRASKKLLRDRQGRRGLSLLEVILAIAILGGSLAAIGGLVRIGVLSAIQTRLRSEANIFCDAKMAELSAGVLELRAYSETPIENEPEWYYTVEVENSTEIGLLFATVTVGQSESEDPLLVSISRFLPDPEYDPAALEEQSQ